MAKFRPPLPRQEDRRSQALVQAHFESLEQDRQKHDAERQVVRTAAGEEEFTVGSGGISLQVFHSLGHEPKGWRPVNVSAAGNVYLSAKDSTSITLTNDSAADWTGSAEVW